MGRGGDSEAVTIDVAPLADVLLTTLDKVELRQLVHRADSSRNLTAKVPWDKGLEAAALKVAELLVRQRLLTDELVEYWITVNPNCADDIRAVCPPRGSDGSGPASSEPKDSEPTKAEREALEVARQACAQHRESVADRLRGALHHHPKIIEALAVALECSEDEVVPQLMAAGDCQAAEAVFQAYRGLQHKGVGLPPRDEFRQLWCLLVPAMQDFELPASRARTMLDGPESRLDYPWHEEYLAEAVTAAAEGRAARYVEKPHDGGALWGEGSYRLPRAVAEDGVPFTAEFVSATTREQVKTLEEVIAAEISADISSPDVVDQELQLRAEYPDVEPVPTIFVKDRNNLEWADHTWETVERALRLSKLRTVRMRGHTDGAPVNEGKLYGLLKFLYFKCK